MISYNEKRVQGRSGPNSLESIGSILLLLVFSPFLCSISAILFWLLATERIGAATRQLHFPLIRANRQRRSRTCQKFTADRYLYKLMIINDHRRIINTIEISKLAAYCCKRRSFYSAVVVSSSGAIYGKSEITSGWPTPQRSLPQKLRHRLSSRGSNVSLNFHELHNFGHGCNVRR